VSADSPDTTQAAEVHASRNAAWAKVAIPLPARQLSAFLSNVERLFRLNPHLEIETWYEEPGQQDTPVYRLSAANQTNACRVDVSIRATPVGERASGLELIYDCGLKRSTEFRVEALGNGSLLTVTEDYYPVVDESDQRLGEVDRSLVPWLAAIRSHLTGLIRFGGLPGYRWWTERIMLGMPPRQRRIVRMIVWVSVLEFVVFLLVALIFWAESLPS